MSDEIERLRKHVEFHKNSERAMFTIAGLKVLLESYDAMMSDEESWERRWIKATKTIAERDEEIEKLRAERNKLEELWRGRPTGTKNDREHQLTKQVEELRAKYDELDRTSERELAACEKERDELEAQVKNLDNSRWLALTHQRDELKAQVERLLANEAKRITEKLVDTGRAYGHVDEDDQKGA